MLASGCWLLLLTFTSVGCSTTNSASADGRNIAEGSEAPRPDSPAVRAINKQTNRTMTYWAGASDMLVHGKPSCYDPPCPNYTLGSPDWETRFALLVSLT